LIFLGRFSNNTKISNFKNICPVGAELFQEDRRTNTRTDRQTNMTKPIVAFRNFAKEPKNCCLPDHFTLRLTESMIGCKSSSLALAVFIRRRCPSFPP